MVNIRKMAVYEKPEMVTVRMTVEQKNELVAKAESEGSGDFSPLWSGQNASGCREVPAGQLTRELAGDL